LPFALLDIMPVPLAEKTMGEKARLHCAAPISCFSLRLFGERKARGRELSNDGLLKDILLLSNVGLVLRSAREWRQRVPLQIARLDVMAASTYIQDIIRPNRISKLQHWCGVWGIFDLKAPPMLEFV
jgi:hypothetical protein